MMEARAPSPLIAAEARTTTGRGDIHDASAQPLSVLMLTAHAGDGGDWVVIHRLCANLIAHGHVVTVAGSGVSRAELPEGVQRIELQLNTGGGGLIRSWQTMRGVRRHFDIVHAHSPLAASLGIMLRPRVKAPVIMTCHLQTPDRGVRRIVKGLLLKRLDLVHCVSDELGDWLARRYSLPAGKVQVVTNSVSAENFYPAEPEERAALRRQHGLSDDQLVMCFVGRLNPEKNIDYLVRFLARFRTEYPKLVLAVAGAGPMEPVLKAHAEKLSVSSQVKFLGQLRQPRNVYAMSDLCVLPTAQETFALVVSEAAMCAAPSLRSNSGGSRAQIIPGVTGEVFLAGDEDDFRTQLHRLVSAADRLPEMGRNARLHTAARFTEETIYPQMESLYRKVIQQSESRK